MTWRTLVPGSDRDVVFALVRASAWADGRVSANELAAARGAAIVLDVLGRADVPMSLARRRDEPEPDISRLTLIGRHVAFAATAWIAWIDGAPTREEDLLLAQLFARLGLHDDEARLIVREVTRSSDDIRRSDAAPMNAQDWAIEIDGLLSWATMFALEVPPQQRHTNRSESRSRCALPDESR